MNDVTQEINLGPTGSERIEMSKLIVDASRVSVFVDPLDGTNQYAKGNYGSVSTLLGITLDDTPVFGIICKPFGQHIDGCYENSKQPFVIYGGTLLSGIYIYGNSNQKVITFISLYTMATLKYSNIILLNS